MIKSLIVANVIVAIICCVQTILIILDAKRIFKRKYPTSLPPKDSTKPLTIIKFTLLVICPILNLFFMCLLLSKCNELANDIVRKIEIKELQEVIKAARSNQL